MSLLPTLYNHVSIIILFYLLVKKLLQIVTFTEEIDCYGKLERSLEWSLE